MHDNVDSPFRGDDDPDLEKAPAAVAADEHLQIVQPVYPDGMAVGVENVSVVDAALAGRSDDRRFHV